MTLNGEKLEKRLSRIRKNPWLLALIKGSNIVITWFTVGAFVVVLWLLFRESWTKALKLALICGVPFCVISLLRKGLNWPRPYEVYRIDPLIDKDTKGESFPSRHVFSIFVIGTSFLYLYPVLGICLLLMGCVLAAVRVLTGVHFTRDVLAGAALGIFSAVIGFHIFML